MKGRRGLTVIELLMVVAIVGLLASVAVPKFRELQRRAMATQLVGDYNALRVAAMTFFTDSGYFPGEASSGVIPANLTGYLPTNFTFAKKDWTLDYDHLTILKWQIVAISFTTPDRALGTTTMTLLGQSPQMSFLGKYSVLLSGP
jgi:prepilin-type N-terminal cleavage/methylation domain-containing protein